MLELELISRAETREPLQGEVKGTKREASNVEMCLYAIDRANEKQLNSHPELNCAVLQCDFSFARSRCGKKERWWRGARTERKKQQSMKVESVGDTLLVDSFVLALYTRFAFTSWFRYSRLTLLSSFSSRCTDLLCCLNALPGRRVRARRRRRDVHY